MLEFIASNREQKILMTEVDLARVGLNDGTDIRKNEMEPETPANTTKN